MTTSFYRFYNSLYPDEPHLSPTRSEWIVPLRLCTTFNSVTTIWRNGFYIKYFGGEILRQENCFCFILLVFIFISFVPTIWMEKILQNAQNATKPYLVKFPNTHSKENCLQYISTRMYTPLYTFNILDFPWYQYNQKALLYLLIGSFFSLFTFSNR